MDKLAGIQRDFNKVIAYSQNIPEPKTDRLFAEWLEAKRDFIELMNGELIYQCPEPVCFELSKKEKISRINDFIDIVSSQYENEELAAFIELEKDGFFINKVVEPVQWQLMSGKEVDIPVGMKLLKAFKFFEENETALDSLQSAASMIIQEDKVEGTLCFSVHPLDFLSLSENTHNWRSCHALDGDYRAGNLSYMVDKSTVIVYLRSNKLETLPNFPDDVKWNSKKWRTLLFFSNNWQMMFAGRSYPFTSEVGLDFIRQQLLPALNLGKWTPWLSKKISSVEDNHIFIPLEYKYIPVGGELRPLSHLVANGYGSLQFNDVLNSSCYDALYSFKTYDNYFGEPQIRNDRKDTHFELGEQVLCCACGEKPIRMSESFMCNDCEYKYGGQDNESLMNCPCCGVCFNIENEGVWVDRHEEYICDSCAARYTVVCENCGERVYTTDAVFLRDRDQWYCQDCRDEKGLDI